jgi:hypothetical protein|tara:strand:- start:318 stop:539 length:222 start_codon:yes stop_codon:yes gene_type:complete
MTIGEWLGDLADSSESTEEDSRLMQKYLRQSGFSKATVVYGVVYLTGYGFPRSVHSMASIILEELEIEKERVS